MIKKIGDYYLNMPVQEMFGLRELSLEEYGMYEAVGIKRIFKDEKMYHGKGSYFAGAAWDTLLAATGGCVYKISLQHMAAQKDESDRILKSAYKYFFKEMGEHNEYDSSTNRYLWESSEGNVILNQASAMEMYGVQLFLTSSMINQQTDKFEKVYEAHKTSVEMFNELKAVNKRYLAHKYTAPIIPIYFLAIAIWAFHISNFFTAIGFVIFLLLIGFVFYTIIYGLIGAAVADVCSKFKKGNIDRILIAERYGSPLGAFFLSLVGLFFLNLFHFDKDFHFLFFLCLIIHSIFFYLDKYTTSMKRSPSAFNLELLVYLAFLFRYWGR